ncbi:hypothetical protein [Winogradskyella sediminis]|uniref:hypothetical protein n=1 Tax=Winogradskyella sediminis TaxID=1382466 RepID=UPI003AA802DF
MNINAVLSSLFRTLALTLVLAVLCPSVIKLNHVFTHHKHRSCEEDKSITTHFHEADIDCDFYKFKLTNHLFIFINNDDSLIDEAITTQAVSYYNTLKDYTYFTRSVRGPPVNC